MITQISTKNIDDSTTGIIVLDETKYLAKENRYAPIKIMSIEDTLDDYDISYVFSLYQLVCVTSTDEYRNMFDYVAIRNPIMIAINNHLDKFFLYNFGKVFIKHNILKNQHD